MYSATKAATILIHEALHQELKEYLNNIRLLLVTTGQMSTAMFKDVEPSKLFFAPIVNHIELAKLVVDKINVGYVGCISKPFYANFCRVSEQFLSVYKTFADTFLKWTIKLKNRKIKSIFIHFLFNLFNSFSTNFVNASLLKTPQHQKIY